jgi:hypothetical protein
MTHTRASSSGLPQVQAVQSHADTVGILGIGGREEAVVFCLCTPYFIVLCGKITQDAPTKHIDAPPANQGSQESSYQEEEACEGVPKA